MSVAVAQPRYDLQDVERDLVFLLVAKADFAFGPGKRAAIPSSERLAAGGRLAVGVTSSSQDNIVISNAWIMRVCGKNGKVFVCELMSMRG